ncbi:MAG: response regulator, partial [Clostridia bacterium]|nr:response regulator [Clostridia bacterium]
IKLATDVYGSQGAYDIVLLDWKMPEMDGLETAKHLRKIIGNSVPIMVLTSYNFDEIEEKAKAVGIDISLSKPFFVSHFRNAIEKLAIGVHPKKEVVQTSTSLAGLKVLAAEDNEINAEILLELLDIEEVQCEVACNGEEALKKFESSEVGQYDMIFMDVQMPVMNGYEATQAIRNCSHPMAKKIPIIAMTANAFEDDVKQALNSGMNAHIAKPIDMDKLKAIVSKLRSEA